VAPRASTRHQLLDRRAQARYERDVEFGDGAQRRRTAHDDDERLLRYRPHEAQRRCVLSVLRSFCAALRINGFGNRAAHGEDRKGEEDDETEFATHRHGELEDDDDREKDIKNVAESKERYTSRSV
jgi:hypothetical protein